MGADFRKEFLRFCIAGSIVTAADFSIYYVLFHFFSFNISKGISYICAGTVGYLLYKYWIFKNNAPSLSEVVRYASVNLLGLGINVFVNHCILSQKPADIFIALIIATSVTSLFSFVCFKWWVFRIYLKVEAPDGRSSYITV